MQNDKLMTIITEVWIWFFFAYAEYESDVRNSVVKKIEQDGLQLWDK